MNNSKLIKCQSFLAKLMAETRAGNIPWEVESQEYFEFMENKGLSRFDHPFIEREQSTKSSHFLSASYPYNTAIYGNCYHCSIEDYVVYLVNVCPQYCISSEFSSAVEFWLCDDMGVPSFICSNSGSSPASDSVTLLYNTIEEQSGSLYIPDFALEFMDAFIS